MSLRKETQFDRKYPQSFFYCLDISSILYSSESQLQIFKNTTAKCEKSIQFIRIPWSTLFGYKNNGHFLGLFPLSDLTKMLLIQEPLLHKHQKRLLYSFGVILYDFGINRLDGIQYVAVFRISRFDTNGIFDGLPRGWIPRNMFIDDQPAENQTNILLPTTFYFDWFSQCNFPKEFYL